MAKCDVCGKDESMPYNCRHCGGTYCSEHRLPENHDCPSLNNWNDPQGVFDSNFDDSVNNRGTSSGGLAAKLPIDTGPGGPLAYFRGNMTYTFLALMWITFALQWIAIALGGIIGMPGLHGSLFTLSSENPLYVWTWVTSVFAHSPVMILHIVFNSIIIFFFGPLVERYVGSKNFALFFVISGAIAGLGFVGINIVQGSSVSLLGASGAAFALLGFITVLNPRLTVYLYFILPVPIWLLTLGLAAIDFIAIGSGQATNVASEAHIIGLLIGLAYGAYVRETQNVRAPSEFQLGGGGPGGPGGGGPGGPGRRRF